MKTFIASIFVIYIIILFGCNKSSSFTHSFPENHWNFEDSIVFNYNIDDVSQNYNIELFFRNNFDYPYRNLYLFLEVHYLDSVIRRDTLEYPITDNYGKWLGRGLGKTRDNYFLENMTGLAGVGRYKFIITHGMRKNPLIGVNNIGVKIITND